MKYVKEHLNKELPANLDKFDVRLGDKLVYLGNTIDRPRLAPGQTVTVKHYWKVLAPIGAGWRPFALVRGPPGTADFMNLEATDMQIGYPVAKWKQGDIIEDTQAITMRPDWGSPYAFLYVGLIEVGKHTTLDRMATAGARTEDRAIVAAKLEVDLSRAPPKPGTVYVPRASGPINIDGMQIDPGWTNAVTSPEFVTADGGSPDPIGKATAKMTWDDQYLYLFISVLDTDITTPYQNRDDSLWKADAVEIFVDADSNRATYIELQVNPHNTKFDSWFTTRASGDPSWNSNMVSEVKIRGTPAPGDTDTAWDVEIGIPWQDVKGRDPNMAVTLPPKIGDRWRMNVVRVDVKTGSDKQSASSWNKIGYGDWHALDRMLTIVFADPTGSIVPANEGASAGSGSGTTIAPPVTPEATNDSGAAGSSAQGSGVGSGVGSATASNAGGSATTGSATGAVRATGSSAGSSAAGSGAGSSAPKSGSSAGSASVGSSSAGSARPPGAGTGGGKGGGTGKGPASGSASTGSAAPSNP
jgi:hypothetical protein